MMIIPRTIPRQMSKEALSVYLDPDIKEDLAAMAKAEDRSMAYIAAKAIEKAVLEWKSSLSKPNQSP
jgi:predicted transcriptional regulator